MKRTLFYIEKHQYSLIELKKVLGKECLAELVKKKVCNEYSVEKLSFDYVGLILYNDLLICVLPKYESEEHENINRIKKIIQVLKQYKPKIEEYDSLIFEETSNELTNIISIADFILDDFVQNGYYRKYKHYENLYDSGEIIWDKTINEITPFISRGRPLYLEYYTRGDVEDTSNIILTVHKYVLYCCYKDFGEILSFSDIMLDISSFDINIIGSEEFIISVLDKELSNTYVDQRIQLLLALKAYFEEQKGSINGDRTIYLYGTRNFQYVWQDICSFIFYNEYKYFKEYIPNPRWSINPDEAPIITDTFIPDIIKTTKNYFFILDAKYYGIAHNDENNKLVNHPGVEDVSKQLLYSVALSSISKNYSNILNVFLFPKNNLDSLIKPFGIVNLSFITPNPVALLYVSVEMVFDMYINRKRLTDSKIEDLGELIINNLKIHSI